MIRGKPVMISTAVLASFALVAWERPSPLGMYEGPVDAKAFGVMTFGPGNVLFLADNDNESIYAVEISDNAKSNGPIDVTGIDQKVAQALGTTADQISLYDMAVHPSTHNVYMTVMRGKGADTKPVLVRVSENGAKISEVSLDNVKHSVAKITNAPASTGGQRDPHRSTITDIAFADGQLWIAGLSNEQFSSAFRRIPFPFAAGQKTTSVEIFHWSHKRNETNAPIMTFTPAKIDGKTYMLAAYTCTPLVAFEVSGLVDGQKVVGRSVVDLGAGNQPYDIISYSQGGKEYVLVANRTHAMMKLSGQDIAGAPGQTTPESPNTLPRTNVSAPGAVTQLADYDANNVLVVQKGASGGFDLKTIAKTTF